MAWPNTMASRTTGMYFRLKYEENVMALFYGDVKIKHMTFFPLEASDEIKEKKAILVAGDLLKFMEGMSLRLEDDGDRSKAFGDLSILLANGEADSSEIPQVIDTHYKFDDE